MLHLSGNDRVTTGPAVAALGRALAECQADRHLRQDSALTTQVGSELGGYTWDKGTQGFASSESAGAQFTALLQTAALCRLLGAGPAIQCLPAAASTQHGCTVQLQLQLSVPSRSRILGWQPAGAAVSAETEALCLTTDTPDTDVMVLVRRPSAAYLPVTLAHTTDSQTRANGDAGTEMVSLQASIELPCTEEATGLVVELWARALGSPSSATGSRPELLVSHMPLLVLPAPHQAAASELAQFVQSKGGVSAYAVLSAPSQNAVTESDAGDLVNDMGVWLSYVYDSSNSTDCDENIRAHMEELGTQLLSYCVECGMVEVAQLVVAAMVHSSPRGTGEAGPTAAAAGSSVQHANGASAVSAWFLAAAKPESGAVYPLLHAAMASGSTDMLEKVLRWGQLYGGRQWHWPWSLTDGSGLTAMHRAAAHADASVCAALLQTVRRMLPGQFDAARAAWQSEQGSVSLTPAQLFAAVHPDQGDAGMWAQQDSGSSKARPEPASAAAAGSPAPVATRATGSSGAGADGAENSGGSSSAVAVAAAAVTATHASLGFWGLVQEAWRWEQSPEYKAWALRKVAPLVHCWARTLTLLIPVNAYRVWTGRGRWSDLACILVHQTAYILIVGASFGIKKLGTWQRWMPLVPWCHTLGSLFMAYVFPPDAMPLWAKTVRGGWVAVATVLLIACGEQNALPYMFLARIALAAAHGAALKAAGMPNPFLLSAAMHTAAVFISACMRVGLVKAFHRWQKDNTRKEGTAKEAALSYEGNMEDVQQRGKLKVQ